MQSGKYIIVGKILSTQGINGWVTIQSFTSNPKDIFTYDLKVLVEDIYQDIKVMEYNFMPKKTTMKIEGLNSIEQANKYLTKYIYISKTDLPVINDDEYYWHQLIGLNVVNEEDIILGVVDSLFTSGDNDVLVVKKDNSSQEVFIPFLKKHLVKIASDTIFVRWRNEL
ncbi:MAG: Ribosome maturation factor RimM [Gammaproteobacteria bacterium]|nr:MAG: Ribosome maturation factor RimM [Gammaproteobacteria bacterium]|tara:strand:- start:9064 stop:9567 length:504 start_codon:yes stop_codon:yes gene_type:complete